MKGLVLEDRSRGFSRYALFREAVAGNGVPEGRSLFGTGRACSPPLAIPGHRRSLTILKVIVRRNSVLQERHALALANFTTDRRVRAG